MRTSLGILAGAALIAAAGLAGAVLAAPQATAAVADLPSRGMPTASAAAAIPSPSLEPDAAGQAEPFRFLQAEPRVAAAYAERWAKVADEIRRDREVLALCRKAEAECPDAARRFLAVVQLGASKAGRARLGEVNRAVNLAIRYTPDLVQHGELDVWSAPLATFASGMGDCEDYAIAKYVALLEIGVPGEDLRLVMGSERSGNGHFVLAARLHGSWLILDNERFALVEDHDLDRYRALASFRLEPPVSSLLASLDLRLRTFDD